MIADSLSPAELDMIHKAFGLDILDQGYTPSLMEEVEWLCGLTSGEHLWDAMWRFGIIIDGDTNLVTESLNGFWNPDGSLRTRARYYVPDDYDTEIPTIQLNRSRIEDPMVSLDSPPIDGAAWDARSI